MELKDLLDSKFPLLEKFRDMAPGSFKHSQNVSNLCEAVAVELDLDTDLLKVAGMYHDIGKINSPDLFSENQNGKNPHDDLEPNISFQVITRHVGDTVVQLLNNIPNDVEQKLRLMEMVSQHHGNTVLRFFYKKSKAKVDDTFRYKSVPPQSIEAAVLMICDSVEATARSLASQSELEEPKDRRAVVNTNVDRLMQDFQLDKITVGHLRSIKSVLYKELESMYHKREAYGDEKDEKVGDDLKIE
jgi:putative nucleotidyltransferase with HDIG domain